MDLQRSFASAWRFKKLFTFVFFDLVGAEYCTARDHVKCEPQNRICVLCWMWVSVSVDNTQRPILTASVIFLWLSSAVQRPEVCSCLQWGCKVCTWLRGAYLPSLHRTKKGCRWVSASWLWTDEVLPFYFFYFFFNLLGKKYTIDTLSPKSLYLLFTSWCSY